MKKSCTVEKVLSYISLLGRLEKEKVITESNLMNREVSILISRYVEGMTISETADKLGITEECLIKAQRKAVDKLFTYLFH